MTSDFKDFDKRGDVYVSTIVPDESGKYVVVAITSAYLHVKVRCTDRSWNHTIIPWSNISHCGWSAPGE